MRSFFIFLILAAVAAFVVLTDSIRELERKERLLSYEEWVSSSSGLQLEFTSRKVTQPQLHTIAQLHLDRNTFEPFQEEKFHASVYGFLKIETPQTYSLELASDDRALLYLDGEMILQNRGVHPLTAKKKKIYLDAGWHYLAVEYDNFKGEASLKVSMGPHGSARQVVGEPHLFLSKKRLKLEDPALFPLRPKLIREYEAVKILHLNQCRFFCWILVAAGVVGLFFRKALLFLVTSKEGAAALLVFGLALWLKLLFYWEYLSQRIAGIEFGGDYNHYLLLPLQWVLRGEWISLNCGNLALTIPLLGTIYQFFGFFPGLHYFVYLTLVLSSFTILFPWLLLRKFSYGWFGLVAGAFLAVHPVLTGLTYPYVSTEFLGFFTATLALCFSVKALLDHRLSSYLFAGVALALMLMTRTVFIPFAVVLALSLVVLSPVRLRALIGLGAFALVVVGYDLFAQHDLMRRGIEKGSYFLYFIRDGVGGSVFHRAWRMPENFLEKIFWLPDHFNDYFKMIVYQSLPLSEAFKWVHVGFYFLVGFSLFALLLRLPRVGLFLGTALATYLFEIASYHVHPRMLLPVCSLSALILALGLKQLHARKFAFALLFLFLAGGAGLAATRTYDFVRSTKKENQFLTWARTEIPKKSILLSPIQTDPWKLYQAVGAPVFYNGPKEPTYVVCRDVVPLRRVLFLAQEAPSQIPEIEKNRHALNGLAQLGYQYILLSSAYARQLEEGGYAVEKIKAYPPDENLGIWRVTWKKTNVNVPDDFDAFLWYWKKERAGL